MFYAGKLSNATNRKYSSLFSLNNIKIPLFGGILVFSLFSLLGCASSVKNSTAENVAFDKGLAIERNFTNGIKIYNKITGGQLLPVKSHYALEQEQFADACRYFDSVIRYDPNNTRAYVYRGLCSYFGYSALYSRIQTFGRLDSTIGFENAVADLKKAIELDPSYIDAYLAMAYLYLESINKEVDRPEGLQEADYYYSKAIRNNPDSIPAYIARGNFYLKVYYGYRGRSIVFRYTDAAADFEMAMKLGDQSSEVLLGLAETYKKLGKGVTDFYDRALEINPDSQEILLARANAYRESKQYDKALEDYGRLVALDSNNLDYHIYSADMYILKNDYSKAIEEYTKTIQKVPSTEEYAALFGRRGDLYYMSNDFANAIIDYNKALRLRPHALAYAGDDGLRRLWHPIKNMIYGRFILYSRWKDAIKKTNNYFTSSLLHDNHSKLIIDINTGVNNTKYSTWSQSIVINMDNTVKWNQHGEHEQYYFEDPYNISSGNHSFHVSFSNSYQEDNITHTLSHTYQDIQYNFLPGHIYELRYEISYADMTVRFYFSDITRSEGLLD
jgi:tetratricopeptide (TPR) repeat protein